MACLDKDPCNPCNECTDQNPCYDDCGCLNPTTWKCITKPGNHPAIGVTDNMNGQEVLQAINDKFNDLDIPEDFTSQDKFVKNSITDTTSGYLSDKIAQGSFMKIDTLNASANEKLRINVNLEKVISNDPGNILDLGTDNKLRVINNSSSSQVFLQEGTGVDIDGTGTFADPFVISTNTSIQVARPCFDSVWKNVTVLASGNTSVTYLAGAPKYRINHTGSIEFKGNISYTVNFGTYSSADREFIVPSMSIPTTCLTSGELNGTGDLKAINYIDAPQAASDQFTQQYGFVLRKVNQNINIEFQSSFIAATSRTITITLDGVVIHPNI